MMALCSALASALPAATPPYSTTAPLLASTFFAAAGAAAGIESMSFDRLEWDSGRAAPLASAPAGREVEGVPAAPRAAAARGRGKAGGGGGDRHERACMSGRGGEHVEGLDPSQPWPGKGPLATLPRAAPLPTLPLPFPPTPLAARGRT